MSAQAARAAARERMVDERIARRVMKLSLPHEIQSAAREMRRERRKTRDVGTGWIANQMRQYELAPYAGEAQEGGE